MEKKSLKSCPFCGGKNIVIHTFHDEKKRWWLECEDCSGQQKTFPTIKSAVDSWNKRKAPK